MDSFTESMLERAKARQKKLEEHYSNTNETLKMPLQEPNFILKKYENSSGLAKSQPNLTECSTVKRKEVVSDTCLNTKSLYYDSSLKENLSDSNLAKKSCTRVSSEMPSSPQSPIKTLSIQKDNFNMEIKLTSSDNVRVEVEIEERDDSDFDNADDIIQNDDSEIQDNHNEFNDKPVIRTDVKNRLQRLGKLYSGNDEVELSSPITKSKFCTENSPRDIELKKPSSSGLGRLKALSNTINQWEDEVTTSKTTSTKDIPKKSWKPPAPKPPTITTSSFTHNPNKGPAPQPPKNFEITKTKVSSREASPEKRVPSSPKKCNSEESKTVAWDNSVIASLESQGFTRTNSNSKIVYNYKKDEKGNENKEELEDVQEEEDQIEEENQVEEEGLVQDTKISKLAARFLDNETEKNKSSLAPKSPSKSNLRFGDVMNKAAKFEQNQSPTKSKDPALMTVSERKALFEKNKGAALVPKAAFGMATPIIKTSDKECASKSIASKSNISPKKSSTSALPKVSSPNKSPGKKSLLSPTKAFIAESGGIASKMKALLERKTTISQSQITNKIQEQREKDLDILLNRFNKNKDEDKEECIEELSSDEESISETTKMLPDRTVKIVQFKEKDNLPPPPPLPPVMGQKSVAPKRRSKGDSPKVREVLDEVKRIRVSPPKSGRMYPCLSDIEASTENENTTAEPSPETSYEDNCSYESEEPNTSFGRDILDVVTKNQTPQKRPILDDSTASDLSDILDGMDDYLDEAMAYGDSDDSEGPTPPKQGKSTPPRTIAAPSHSFHYSPSPSKYHTPVTHKSPSKHSPVKNNGRESPKKCIELPTHVVDGDNILPLAHTVSFYRKQQAQGPRTPIRQVIRQPAVEEESPEIDKSNEASEVSEKIQELMNTVSKQQTVISQASQALNLCCSTIEFSGSSEQVEAERLLLVATQRRQAALHEVQRLRVEGTLHPGGGTAVDKGTLIISDINLPLKKEYVRALSAAGGQGHHVVCLIRYAEHVIPTRLVSTVASPKDEPELNLKVPGSVKLENIYKNFTVTVEVYSLQAQEELLPHEVKYHINTKKSGGKLTPKRHKHDSKLVMPSIQSPAGPHAVRSPSFALMGYAVFSLQAINRKHWTLNNAPPMSPLEGSVQMKVNCELAVSVEHRGFLSMFDDISGFGAWHRRWCLLQGNNLSYWKYPDDERKKAPIDSISLQACTTKNVEQVSREICARPYTFLLETIRPAKSSDKDSLVTVCRGNKTMIRHLLSADTKEERIEWCEKFNKALEAMRLWGTNKN